MKAKIKQKSETNNSTALISLTTFTPDKKEEFTQKVEVLKKEIGVFKITNPELRVKASDFLSRVQKAYNILEAKRKELVTPFNTEVKRINAEFKFIQSPLESLEASIKAEISRDFKEQQKIQEEINRKAKEEEEKQLAKLHKQLNSKDALTAAAAENKAEAIITEAQAKIESAAPITSIRSSAGSPSISKIWKWEVVDAWKVTNEVMINSAVKSGQREISGLRIYEDVSVAGGR